MTKKHKKILIISLCAVIAVVAAGVITAKLLFGNILKNNQTVYVYIDQNDNIDSVCAKIDEVAQPSTLKGFRLLASWKDYDEHIRTGRYEIKPDMSIMEVFRMLRNHQQAPINLVVPSVRTLNQLSGRLSAKLMIDSLSIDQVLSDESNIKELGFTKETFPALFIPNTYEVNWDISADDLLKRMVREYKTFWTEERLAKAKAQQLSQTEVATLASIIDSETAYTPEKPTVAGLYLNRLRTNMLLQSDPTVIFAIGDFSMRRVLNKDLQVESPYNTYKYKGLPPGPIRIPSISAIDAVLNPVEHDYIYMCAKEDFSGSHNFATTYNEHLANARRYTKALNERGIKR